MDEPQLNFQKPLHKESRTSLPEIIGIALGAFIVALGFNLFLIPNKIAAGGAGGLATVFYYLYNFPVGLMTLLLNIPLFIAAARMYGKGYIFRSLLGTVLLSAFIDLQAAFPIFSAWTEDALLGSVYGGILVGLGLGLIFRARGTTGGSELFAALLSRRLPLSLGMLILVVDGAVIVLAGIVFELELALYALISVFITAKLIDLMQEGFANSKALLIISDRYRELAELLPAQTGRGMTALTSRGVYSGTQRETLLIVVGISQMQQVKKLVHYVDPHAFIIVANASEVLGEGFKKNRF